MFAPGVQIYSAVPGNAYEFVDGTSIAAPIVSGIAAILRAYFPALTAKEVKKILVESSIKVNHPIEIPGSEKSGTLSDISVSGAVVNAYEAVKMALAK